VNIRCDRCGREPDEVAPMLKDVIWRHLARKNETLCKACAHEAIRRRFGRELRFADLLPCAFNITWCSAFEELMPWDEPLETHCDEIAVAIRDFLPGVEVTAPRGRESLREA
jgi:hypothetical protein